MSLIHCSPLFHPLEPLPLLGPAAVRSAERMHFPSNSKSLSASGGPSIPSKKKNKKAAILQRPTNSPASTDLSTPTAAGSPYSVRQLHAVKETSTSQPGHSPIHVPNTRVTQQPYQEVYFDSQGQGSLTFTTESQPMEDLSSSQQIRDRDH